MGLFSKIKSKFKPKKRNFESFSQNNETQSPGIAIESQIKSMKIEKD